MRKKYKNLQKGGENQKGFSFVVPERRSQVISDNNIKNINKNSFISNFERKSADEKIINKDKDFEKPRITVNTENINIKRLDNIQNNNKELKSSNHNILISVYKKDLSSDKKDKKAIQSSKLNKNIIKHRNENKNYDIKNQNLKNNTLIKNNHRNSKRILTNANNQNSVQSFPNIFDKNDLIQKKEQNNNKNENENQQQIEIIKKRNDNDNENKIKYKRKKSYNIAYHNEEIDIENNNNNNNHKKTELKISKQKTENTNYNSTNNIVSLHKVEKINNVGNNYNSNTERNLEDKNQLLNFKKTKNKDNNTNNINDDKSKNSFAASYLLTPNNNNSTKVKRKLEYRSKKSLNPKDLNEIDINIINNNQNSTENINKDIKKRQYIIKVTKTPNESIINNKNNDKDLKVDNLNEKKKKIRYCLYYNINKDNKDNEDIAKKEIKPKKEDKLLSPTIIKNPSIKKNEIYNTPVVNFKKLNNHIYKISQKQSNKEKELTQKKHQIFYDNSFNNLLQKNRNDDEMGLIINKDLNQSFTYFPNGLEGNNNNSKKVPINNIYTSNMKNQTDKSNNLLNSKLGIYKNNSVVRNKNSNSKTNSPTTIIYRKKMNLIKSICNYYKKNIGELNSNLLLNSNYNSNIEKRKNNYINKMPVTDKREKKIYNSRDNILNNIINNNTFNTTLNIYKMNKDDISNDIKNKNDKIKNDRKEENNNELIEQGHEKKERNTKNRRHLRRNSELPDINTSIYFSIFNENSSNLSNKNSTTTDLSEIIKNTKKSEKKRNALSKSNNENYKIDIKILYILEIKLQNILNKINNYLICTNECFNLITYYFSSKFYEKVINIFKSKRNISYYIKLELLCYFLCYDICFNKSFSQAGILLKTIFNLLHNNFLILISFILNSGTNNRNNSDIEELINKLKSIIKNNLKHNPSPHELNETVILSLIDTNIKEITTFYKMIVDNIYSQNYIQKKSKRDYNDIKYKFPQCLQLDINDLDYYEKLNIISLFFFDTYRLVNNYNFEDLKYFFDSFLQRLKMGDPKKSDKKVSRNKFSNNKGLNLKSVVIYKYNYNNGKFYYLPPIKKCYKYTLVLDLDETLVYLMHNNIYLKEEGRIGEGKHTLIFRPGLIDFLKKMRPLFELVIFSFGTYEYVDSVIKIIEKKGKFFEHVLYRQHATDSNGEYIKDLSLLGRDLKNIIIVDDIPQVFKMQEKNGICIKPFFGDIVTDKNTLNILGKILEKIRYDAEEDGDIRKSLDRQRNLIIANITNID